MKTKVLVTCVGILGLVVVTRGQRPAKYMN